MGWFRKTRKGLESSPRLEVPRGLWVKCEQCGEIIYRKALEEHLHVCVACGYHFRIGARAYLEIVADAGFLEEFDADLASRDPLEFVDSQRYTDRLKKARGQTSLREAVCTGQARVEGREVVLALMDFGFMGGSMGSVVGEKIARATRRATERGVPLITVSASGGARMQEGLFSLMQMVKTNALLALHRQAGLLFISVLTHPTTGGVTASFAMLGDVIVAEPGALIGFAGPRVIRQTIGQDLPAGFQTSEFLLEHGFIDVIVPRSRLKATLARLLGLLAAPLPVAAAQTLNNNGS